MDKFIYGLLLSGSMIMAIGAQNVFVIKNGIVRNHALSIAFVCFLCDVLLMFAGVFFIGSAAALSPYLLLAISIVSCLFLLWYGFGAFKAAYKGNYALNVDTNGRQTTRKKALLSALGITLLNPHVYLDTVVIVGGVAAQLSLLEKWQFIGGALTASAVWFFSIAYFSRYALRLFQKQRTWVIFDAFVAAFMWFLAANIAWYAWHNISF